MKTERFYYETFINGNLTEFVFTNNETITKFKDYIKRNFRRRVYEQKYVGNLDLMAYEEYNEELLWWVIALINGINDPFSSIKVGESLMIPHIMDIFDFYKDNINTDAFE